MRPSWHRALFEAEDCARALVGRDGTILEINNASLTLVEADRRDQVVGHSIIEFVAPEERDSFNLHQINAPKTAVDFLVLTCKGRSRIVENLIIPVPGRSGEIEGTLFLGVDVTELRRQEQRQSLLASVVTSADDAILTCSGDLIITSWNKGAEALYGYNAGEMIGNSIDLIVPPRLYEHVQSVYQRLVEHAGSTRFDTQRRRKDGTLVDVSVSVSGVYDSNGMLLAAASISRDITDRRRLEQELRQAQSYTRGLIESSVDAMIAVAPELVITDVNEQAVRLTEMPRRVLINSRFDSYFADPELAAEALRRALSDGFITNCDLAIRTRRGQDLLVSLSASIFRDAVGKIRGVFAVLHEVTEERLVARRLREQQEYNRRLFEASLDGMVTVDASLVVTDANQQAERLSGFGREELIGNPLAAFFSGSVPITEVARKALAEGSVRDCEFMMMPKSGEIFDVSVNASVLRSAEGQTRGLLFAIRDIGERKRAEQERSFLASIVASSDDAIYAVGSDSRVLAWNAGAERLFGYSAAEMIGRSIDVLNPLEERAAMARIGRATMRDGTIRRVETKRLRKDGSSLEVAIAVSPMRDRDGKIIANVAIARDITERKRFEAELTEARDSALEAARIKSEFLANMSHEIRTPLNSIMGLTGLLLDRGLSAEQMEHVHDMQEAGESLLWIINDILDFSKIVSGRMPLEMIDFELEGTLGGAIDLFAAAAAKKGLELKVAIDSDVPRMLRGDPARLRQVLANLVSNAVKFTECGEVAVHVRRASVTDTHAELAFEVADTGIGIARDAQRDLFKPFTQVDASTTRRYGGTGLGLAIAAQLVEAMNGKIGVASSPGAGSTFWFNVLFEKQPQRLQPVEPNLNLTLEGVAVLVVDDDPSSSRFILLQVRSWGMHADSAASSAEALSAVRARAPTKPYELVIIDVQNPEKDGLELARQIKADPAGASATVVVCSQTEKEALQHLATAASVDAFLARPVSGSRLYDTLVNLIVRSRGIDGTLLAGIGENGRSTTVVPYELGLANAHGAPLRVLIAEDNTINRKLALHQVRKLGCEADGVANGAEAVRAATRLPYDVILMDCQMPEMDGYEAVRKIRIQEGTNCHTFIAAMTAHALKGDREKCIAAGMDDYLSKPVKTEELVKVLKRAARIIAARHQSEGFHGAWRATAEIGLNGVADSPPNDALGVGPGDSPIGAWEELDLDVVAELRGEGEGLLDTLIDMFAAHAAERLEEIAQALDRRDMKTVETQAHKFKGSAASLGAKGLQQLADAIEQTAHRGALEELPAMLEQLRSALGHVMPVLNAQRTTPAGDSSSAS